MWGEDRLLAGSEGVVSLLADLLLDNHDSVQEAFRGGRATRDVDIDGADTVNTSCDRIGIMVVTTAVSTGTHGHDVTGLRDLIVQTTEGRSHLVCESTGDNHDISLTRSSTRNHTESFEIVTGRGGINHFHSATGKTESEGVDGTGSAVADGSIEADDAGLGGVHDLLSSGDGGSGQQITTRLLIEHGAGGESGELGAGGSTHSGKICAGRGNESGGAGQYVLHLPKICGYCR